MSVESGELMSDVWTRWQGKVVNGAFPLGRFVGCSDHGGVFVTKAAALGASDLAIKLVPADRALAELMLRRWKRAGGINHPHLMKLLQWGGCQLDGLPHLYVVMEYADQTLAQVLARRALAEDEAQKMLRPTLDALAFLHGQHLVQGQLKPANILVVGDELKLASDTIRRVSEDAVIAKSPTPYDPPDSRHGNGSTAADVWALGVCLLEALTRRPPTGWAERGEGVTLPADFSPAFREVVARCLSLNRQDRPSAMELIAWVGGQAAGSASEAATNAVTATPQPPAPEQAPAPPPAATAEASRSEPSTAPSPSARTWLAVVLGAFLIAAVGAIGVRIVQSQKATAPTSDAAAPVVSDVRPPASATTPSTPRPSDLATSVLVRHEAIPEVPLGARRTITGHIKVWVRVIVDPDGSVFAATTDRNGPSKYFQRLAIDAAKQWTFPPLETQSRRLMQIRFDFSRDGTTGQAVSLQ